MPGYVDLHAHYLPGLDDGAPDLPMTMEMVRTISDLGFVELFATPHQRVGLFMPQADAIREAFALVAREVAAAAPALKLGVAAENFWDDVFHARTRGGGLPTYGGGPAFLVEVSPQLMPPNFEQELFQLRVSGRLPVLAHPERYAAIQGDVAVADRLGRATALLVDLAALDGAHGRAEMKTARRLLQEGIAHAAATDLHRASDGAATAAGIAWIKKHLGERALDRLLADNPRRILAGELPDRAR